MNARHLVPARGNNRPPGRALRWCIRVVAGDRLSAGLCAFHSQVLNSSSISHAQPCTPGQAPGGSALYCDSASGLGEGRVGETDWDLLDGQCDPDFFLVGVSLLALGAPRFFSSPSPLPLQFSQDSVRPWDGAGCFWEGWWLQKRLGLILLRCPWWSVLPAHPLPAPPSGPALTPHTTAEATKLILRAAPTLPSLPNKKKQKQKLIEHPALSGEGKWSIGRQLRRQSGDQDLWIGTLEVPEKTSCTRAPGSKGLGGPTVRKGSQHSGSCAKVGARCAGRPTRRAQSGERPPNRL